MSTCPHCGEAQPCAAKIEIFRQLSREEQQRVSSIARHMEVRRGTLLFTPENTPGLFLISSGKVKVYSLPPSGKETLLRVLGEGDFVGEEALFGDGQTENFAEVLTDTRVCLIRRDDFLPLLMAYPSISLKLLEELNRRLVSLSRQAASETAGSVKNRLVCYLLELSDAQQSSEITLPLSRKELAAFLDTTPETLSRRLTALVEDGLLARHGRTLTILDREKLADTLEH